MLFHSQQFLLFFPVVFAVYWLLPAQQLRKWLLLVASCVFYMSWNVWFVLLIAFTSSVDFFAARLLVRFDSPRLRRSILLTSVGINLAILVYFKYANFFIDNLCTFLHSIGFQSHRTVLQVILPLGISFYTFETISYVVDVYKGTTKPCRSLLDYATFIMFFPHLIAGPIVRARDFLPQLLRNKRWSWTNTTVGAQLFILGLFKKVVIADHLSTAADPIFQNAAIYSSETVWLAVFAYTAQIFCDFSGYTDMAIGLARMFGYKLKPNFNLPYLSRDLADFWRRWHISLSSWMRDYVYIPLGGNRSGEMRNYGNLFATMVICGFWHGAAWQFVAWGGYHGALLVLNHRLRNMPHYAAFSKIAGVPTTFLLVSLGWVLFRAPSIPVAWQIYSHMFHPTAGSSLASYAVICSVACLILFGCGHFLAPLVKGRRLFLVRPALVALGMSLMLMGILLFRPDQRTQFIYFQF
jgi:alginate O-acetyltransferase complex protein AlgI